MKERNSDYHHYLNEFYRQEEQKLREENLDLLQDMTQLLRKGLSFTDALSQSFQKLLDEAEQRLERFQ